MTVVAAILSVGLANAWPLVVCADADNPPYSSRTGAGFENEIAEIVADELGARLEYTWIDSPVPGAHRRHLLEGRCDMIMAAADGQSGYETSRPYYTSSYVFIQRADHPRQIDSYDDPALEGMRVGSLVPDGGQFSPPMQALVGRGLGDNHVGFVARRTSGEPVEALFEALTDGDVDLAIAWGPIAGYFAARAPVELAVRPVQPQIDAPFVPMYAAISAAFRAGDIRLTDRVSEALVRRWDDVQAVLDAYEVPRIPMPKPRVDEER
jgi:mxaJ protein